MVKLFKKSGRTEGGLYLPEDKNEDKPQEGKVVAIGDSSKIRVKKNQRIIFAKYSGTEIEVEKEEYLILKSEDILAVIE